MTHQEVVNLVGVRTGAGVIHGKEQNGPFISGVSALHSISSNESRWREERGDQTRRKGKLGELPALSDGRLCRQQWKHQASCKSYLQNVKVPEIQRYFEALRSSPTSLYARRSIIEGTFSMHIIVEHPKVGAEKTLSVPKRMVIKQGGQGPLRENA